MVMNSEAHQKVTTAHLSRLAYLYVRQSTLRQVFENTESTHRQYALRERALALGWPLDRIVVIDSDLGQSGASAADREGFQRLVTEVSLGRVGIVLGLEVSRPARNSTDWHRLLELCALADTLILDEDGLYDPAHFNDRLLLGLKGTMSEAELHVLKARLRGGILSRARRGELKQMVPVGFAHDAQDRVILDPDAQVQGAVRLFFETFLSGLGPVWRWSRSSMRRNFCSRADCVAVRIKASWFGPNCCTVGRGRLSTTRAMLALSSSAVPNSAVCRMARCAPAWYSSQVM
jgi:DNA invertase Pin-like site-specific DNA recombinase